MSKADSQAGTETSGKDAAPKAPYEIDAVLLALIRKATAEQREKIEAILLES